MVNDEQKPTEPTPGKALQTQPVTEFEEGGKPDPLQAELEKHAKTFGERELAFKLATQARQALMIRKAAQAIAETGWGQNITPIARAAVARYAFEVGCDPVRHINVLGGNIYFNAQFYQELVADNPDFQHDDVEFIHDDPRALEQERAYRKEKRIAFGVPEAAKGAAIVTLHYKSKGPFVGVNWAGTGRKSPKHPERLQDPIGEEEPTKTAHTRAYRKAAMKAEPTWFRTHPRLKGVEEIVLTGRVDPEPTVPSRAQLRADDHPDVDAGPPE